MSGMGILEAIAYAVARGITRAYLDTLAERAGTAREEQPNEDDRARARRMRDSALGLRNGQRQDADAPG